MELWYLSRNKGVSFSLIQLLHADTDAVSKHEIQKGVLLTVEVSTDDHLDPRGPDPRG
jgi:hypothetical protein